MLPLPDRSLASGLLRSVMNVAALRVASLVLSLTTAVFLARLLGAADYGHYAFTVSLATLLSLPVGQGITRLLTREISQAMQDGRFGVHKGILQWAWWRLMIYSLVVLGILLAAWPLVNFIGPSWLAAASLAPLVAGYQVYGGATRGHGFPVHSQTPEMLARPLGVLLLALITWMIYEVTLVSALAFHLIATGLGLWLSHSLCKSVRPIEVRAAAPEQNAPAWSRSSLSFVLITASNFIGIEIGILTLGILGQPAQVSGMRVAQSGAQLVMLALVAADVTTQSQIAVLAREGGGNSLRRTYVRATRLAFTVAMVLATILVVWRESLVGFAFGEEFVPLVVDPLTVLVVMGLVSSFFGPSGTLLSMAGQESKTLNAQALGLTITVVGVASLASSFGATGAALAITSGMVVKKLAEAIFVRRHFGAWLSCLSSYR